MCACVWAHVWMCVQGGQLGNKLNYNSKALMLKCE